MPELPDYISGKRKVKVTVKKPEAGKKTYKTGNDFVRFIDVRPEGVWIRGDDELNRFYPMRRVLEIEMGSSHGELPERLQKQRRM